MIDKTILPRVLVQWSIGPEEWARYCNWELKDRRNMAIITAILVTLFGAVLLRVLKQAPWWAALMVSTVIAMIYAWIQYRISRSLLGNTISAWKEILVTPDAVLINGRKQVFNNSIRQFKQVTILENIDPKILEIVYEWPTRSGTSTDEIHIPIPKGRLGDAIRLMEKLKSNNQFSNDAATNSATSST